MGDCKCVDLITNSKKKRDNRAKHPPPPTLPGASGGRGGRQGRRAAGGCWGDRRSPSPLQASSLLVVTRGEAVQVRGSFC